VYVETRGCGLVQRMGSMYLNHFARVEPSVLCTRVVHDPKVAGKLEEAYLGRLCWFKSKICEASNDLIGVTNQHCGETLGA